MQALHEENVRLRSNIKERYRFGKIIGKSPVMQEIYELILKAAAPDVNVILYGESGTGKELVARAVHSLSKRKSKTFVTVNCGALPDNLLESELFGYKKGAFTDALMSAFPFAVAGFAIYWTTMRGELQSGRIVQGDEPGSYWRLGW